MDTTSHLLVLCTCPDQSVARQLATGAVQARLAACVNIIPNLQSIYEWEGKIMEEIEYLLLIKTHNARYADLATYIQAQHPYKVPEIIALPITQGTENYLAWLNDIMQIPS